MTNNDLRKYLIERNYQLTTDEADMISNLFQVASMVYALGGRICYIKTNCNEDFTVMIKSE